MDAPMTAEDWIATLELQPHPEGGFFKEAYRADEFVSATALPDRYDGPRCFGTSIFFLLRGEDVSRFHRLRSDEIWHFYAGVPLVLHRLDASGGHAPVTLGPDPRQGHALQAVVPHGAWFGAEVMSDEGFGLVGCTVAPGFDFADFELADPALLRERYPAHLRLVDRLT